MFVLQPQFFFVIYLTNADLVLLHRVPTESEDLVSMYCFHNFKEEQLSTKFIKTLKLNYYFPKLLFLAITPNTTTLRSPT